MKNLFTGESALSLIGEKAPDKVISFYEGDLPDWLQEMYEVEHKALRTALR